MKSITDATWKDAAIIEARSLVARLEDVAGKHATDPATLQHVTLESLTRQASKLSATIERIEEAPKPAPRSRRKRGAASPADVAAAVAMLEEIDRKGAAEVHISPDARRLLTQSILTLRGGRQ